MLKEAATFHVRTHDLEHIAFFNLLRTWQPDFLVLCSVEIKLTCLLSVMLAARLAELTLICINDLKCQFYLKAHLHNFKRETKTSHTDPALAVLYFMEENFDPYVFLCHFFYGNVWNCL